MCPALFHRVNFQTWPRRRINEGYLVERMTKLAWYANAAKEPPDAHHPCQMSGTVEVTLCICTCAKWLT